MAPLGDDRDQLVLTGLQPFHDKLSLASTHMDDSRDARGDRVIQGREVAVHEDVVVPSTGLMCVRGRDRDTGDSQTHQEIGTGNLGTLDRGENRDACLVAPLASATGGKRADEGEKRSGPAS